MKLQAGPLQYEWIEGWGNFPKSEGFAHHGMALSRAGEIYTADAAKPIVRVMSQSGELIREIETPVGENHCIALSEENDDEVLWIADTGPKAGATGNPPRVIKCDLAGKLLAEITRGDLGYEAGAPFVPTAVCVDNDGSIYIADGYGSSLVHALDSDLKRRWTLDGSRGAGRFTQPHWVMCDRRKGKTEIYVADRRNHRLQVFNPGGDFIRAIEGGLNTPSGLTSFGNYLVVAELEARLVILDGDDNLVGYLGSGRGHVQKPGWPNRHDSEGNVCDPLADIPEGQFNSPHGIVANPEGDIFVSEWLLGGRFIKLKRVM